MSKIVKICPKKSGFAAFDRARDAVQDTFIRFCKLEPDKRGEHLRSWLLTTCRNRSLDVLHNGDYIESIDGIRWIKFSGHAVPLVHQNDEINQALTEAMGVEKERLQPRQRRAIRRAAARQGKVRILSSRRHARLARIAPLVAAGAIIGGIVLLFIFPKLNESGGANYSIRSGLNAQPQQRNVIRLPLKASGDSLSRITNAIRREKRLPTKNETSILEMLNSFPLRANGAVAHWHGCKLGAEILPSPWKPSTCLVLVEIQGATDAARNLTVEYRAKGGDVIAHRLIGYPEVSSISKTAPTSKMAANSRTLLVIEVESRGLQLGSLHWSVRGKAAPPLPLVRDPEHERSDDACFVSLVCAFGLWLRCEYSGFIDADIMLALAREVASRNLSSDRYDFLTLIDEATKLAINN